MYLKSLNTVIPKSSDPIIWLHGPSVGELDQCKAFARVIKSHLPNAFIFQTVFSDSVKEEQLIAPEISVGAFLPFDFFGSYDALFDHIKPSLIVIFSWDTWPNFCYSAKKRSIPLVLAAATLSPNSGREKSLAKNLTKFTLLCFKGIYPSHQMFKNRFETLVEGKVEVEVLGDTRYDAVLEKLETQKPPASFTTFLNLYPKEWLEAKPILFGSTYSSCETLLLHFVQSIRTFPPIWVFPHHWETERMNDLARQLQCPVVLFSEVLEGKCQPEKIVLFDRLGILAFAYQYARFSYVGGALHNRVHNTIEPAAHGNFLITGDKISNASEAIVMREMGGLFSGTASQILSFLNENHSSPSLLEKGKRNQSFVLENRGASLKLYNKLLKT